MSPQEERIDPALFEAMRKKIKDLEQRVTELENERECGSAGGIGADSRDRAVLDHLTQGERVTVNYLRRVYRSQTDIRSKRTVKDRVQSLTGRPEFRFVSPGTWVYEGKNDE